MVIPGQPFDAGARRRRDVARARPSMTPETGCRAATGTYTFTGLKPGTFLYQSGSHMAVQVQMGLYGAMTKDARAAGKSAYAGIPYAHEAAPRVQRDRPGAARGGRPPASYGIPDLRPVPTSTIDYRPSLFLINGESYTNEATASDRGGHGGEATLLRLLNAGLRTHAPVLDNGSLRIVAEDGNPLPYAKDQAAVMLAAGKTHDALWTPAAAGVYSLYDRTPRPERAGTGRGGHAREAERRRRRRRADPVMRGRRQLRRRRGLRLPISGRTSSPTTASSDAYVRDRRTRPRRNRRPAGLAAAASPTRRAPTSSASTRSPTRP